MARCRLHAIIVLILIPLVSNAADQDRDRWLSVSLDTQVQFIDPDGNPVTAIPGVYRVERSQQGRLLLIQGDSPGGSALRAQVIEHKEKLAHPMVIMIPRNDGTRHLVYLLPDGTGFVAVGRTGAVQERGLLSSTLTSDEVKLYLALKLDQSAKNITKPDPKLGKHDDEVTALVALLRSQPGGPEMIAKAQQAGVAFSSSHSDSDKVASRKRSQGFYSVELTPNEPHRSGASLAISSDQVGATITVKIPQSGWYLVNLRAKVHSSPVRASLSVARVIKTVLSGKAGRSAPMLIRSWEQTTPPGDEQSYPALVELKAGEQEFIWTVTTGSAEVLEARLLSL